VGAGQRVVRQLLAADPDGYLLRLSQLVSVLPTYLEPDASDLLDPMVALGSCIESGVQSLLVDENALPAEFFDLSSGFAGELLHKLSTYRIRLAGVVPDPSAHSSRFEEFLRESNRGRQFRFFPTREEAIAWLDGRSGGDAP
jgi:hypothetical protein